VTALVDGSTYATCPITRGALVRAAIRQGFNTADALEVLDRIASSDRHEFWPDELGYEQVRMRGVIGHRQVTDADLAQRARERNGRLVTFDEGAAGLHSDVAELVPTS
jgi:predicted nucleic acid-binding protein